MSNFMIGWGEADITPDAPKVELAGQYYQRVARGIHSRLKTVALVMQKEQDLAVMIALDVVGIPEELQNQAREIIHQAIPEIPLQAIFLNAIHTHNAPYVRPAGLFRDWLPLDDEALKPADYIEFLLKRVLDAVKQAWAGRQPGAIANAFGQARIGHCRRAVYANGSAEMYGDTNRADFVGMEAGEDSGVELLFTYDAQRRPTGAIVNVACPSQVMEATYEISSDYMGATRELLKGEFGADFHTLCQISAAGCQAPRDLVRRYRSEPDFWHADGVAVHAQRLFTATMAAFKEIPASAIQADPLFQHRCARVDLPIRRASYCDYVKAKAEIARLTAIMPEYDAFLAFCKETHDNEAIPGRPGPYDSKLHHFVLIQNAKAVVKRYETQDTTPHFSYDMQTLRIGDCAMVNVPFELYLVFGQIIKARSLAKQTFVVQLSGGTCGYLPSPEAERFGGYGGLIVNGRVGSDGGYLLADTAVQKINSLFA
ncbi:MAG: neutral/alkaline non-lysosomal ceramidase N-terminal domain-containing protein [Lentisphaeria bacterium]|nr:neutral/alkaline non-lysosomal ceramidase N-terminal domain-containing protein [Lentisphaeria bacterium]